MRMRHTSDAADRAKGVKMQATRPGLTMLTVAEGSSMCSGDTQPNRDAVKVKVVMEENSGVRDCELRSVEG